MSQCNLPFWEENSYFSLIHLQSPVWATFLDRSIKAVWLFSLFIFFDWAPYFLIINLPLSEPLVAAAGGWLCRSLTVQTEGSRHLLNGLPLNFYRYKDSSYCLWWSPDFTCGSSSRLTLVVLNEILWLSPHTDFFPFSMNSCNFDQL